MGGGRCAAAWLGLRAALVVWAVWLLPLVFFVFPFRLDSARVLLLLRCGMLREVYGKLEDDVDYGPIVPITYYNVKDITKKLDLGPGMAKEDSSTKISGKRKVALKLSKDEVASSRVRKRPQEASSSFRCGKAFSTKEVSSAQKSQVKGALSSSTKVKHVVGIDSKKAYDMRDNRDPMPKSSAEKSKTVIYFIRILVPSLILLLSSEEQLIFLVRV
ncbi:unnamed protein product [Prunus armeniaca]